MDFTPSRSELLHELAALLLSDEIDGPLAIALGDYAPNGPFDLAVRALPASDPVTSLFGFRAPDEWIAFGVALRGTARALDHVDGDATRVRVAYIIDRHGIEASLAVGERTGAPTLVDTCGPPSTEGRVPDTCRRVLGLPTAPADVDPQRLWIIDWFDRMLAAVLALDLDAPRLSWPQLLALYRGRSSTTAPWAILRRECAVGELEIAGISPADAEWMDDGMFSREVLGSYPDPAELVGDLCALLPPNAVRLITELARLQLD